MVQPWLAGLVRNRGFWSLGLRHGRDQRRLRHTRLRLSGAPVCMGETTRGSLTVSQVSAGRRNRLFVERSSVAGVGNASHL